MFANIIVLTKIKYNKDQSETDAIKGMRIHTCIKSTSLFYYIDQTRVF